MMFYSMFQSQDLVLALVHLFFLLLNFGITCPLIFVPVYLLPASNQNLRPTYFVKPSNSFLFSSWLWFFVCFPSFVGSLFSFVGCDSLSLVWKLSRSWYTLRSNPGVIASLAW